MRAITVAASLVSLALATGCSSAASSKLLAPELAVARVGGQSSTMQNVAGGLPVEIRASLFNPSAETIVLRRLTVVSLAEGGVTIPSTSRPFDVTIPSNQTRTVDFWVPGYVSNLSASGMIGSNAPITVRINAVFNTPFGSMQKTYVEQIGYGSSQVHQ